MPNPPERTAVIGWGSVSPLGQDPNATWERSLAGASGISSITASWADDLAIKIAGQVPASALDSLEPLLQRRSDRCAQLALIAARQAWEMAQPFIGGIDPSRIAVVLGTGIGGLSTMHEQHSQLTAGGPSRVNPLTVPMLIPDAAAGQVAIDLGAQGGAHTPVSACASSAEALMLAQMLLNDDRADLVIAGGTEAPVNRLGLVGFSAMRALSPGHHGPTQASRPYSQDRDGFVLSEGAGMLALMRASEAPVDSAQGWLLACGSSSDAHHIVARNPKVNRPALRSTMPCAVQASRQAISVRCKPTPPAPALETLPKLGRFDAVWALRLTISPSVLPRVNWAISWVLRELWKRSWPSKH